MSDRSLGALRSLTLPAGQPYGESDALDCCDRDDCFRFSGRGPTRDSTEGREAGGRGNRERHAAAVPALKYMLLPELRDRQPGNQVQAFYKCFMEQNHFYHDKATVEQREKWGNAPLADLAGERRSSTMGAIAFARPIMPPDCNPSIGPSCCNSKWTGSGCCSPTSNRCGNWPRCSGCGFAAKSPARITTPPFTRCKRCSAWRRPSTNIPRSLGNWLAWPSPTWPSARWRNCSSSRAHRICSGRSPTCRRRSSTCARECKANGSGCPRITCSSARPSRSRKRSSKSGSRN